MLRPTRIDSAFRSHADQVFDPQPDERVEHDEDDVGDDLDEDEFGAEHVEDRVPFIPPERRALDDEVVGAVVVFHPLPLELEELGHVVGHRDEDGQRKEQFFRPERPQRMTNRVIPLNGHW